MKTVWRGRPDRNSESGYQLLTNQTRRGANRNVDRVCAPSLELYVWRAGFMKKCLRFQPDRGNPAVRDDRGGRRKQTGARIEAPAYSR